MVHDPSTSDNDHTSDESTPTTLPDDRILDHLRNIHANADGAGVPPDTGSPTRPQDPNSGQGPDDQVDGPPNEIPGYNIVRELHHGGQGIVYQAIQQSTGRKVAVKVMREGPHASPASRERFKREIALVAGLDHPNIVKVFDSGIASGQYFFAMDYIRGKRLDLYVNDSGLTVAQIVDVFRRICDAIQYAHRRGVIHRDLKPSNILVDQRGEPHVLDFGMAKAAGLPSSSTEGALLSITGQVLGTLAYMSPEQAKGEPDAVDSRTDVYSLGVILYELITGRLPYEVVENIRDMINRIIDSEPKKPSQIRRVNNDIETIVLKSLAKHPDRRYQSAAELQRDLEHFQAGEPIEAKRDSVLYVLMKRIRRRGRALTRIAIAFLFILVVGLAIERQLRKASPPTTAAVAPTTTTFSFDENVPALLREPPPDDWVLIDRDAEVTIKVSTLPMQLFPIGRDPPDLVASELVFERLFWRDASLDLIPNEHLVEAIDDDPVEPRSKLVRLRPGVRWHDEALLTAEDIVFSWKLVNADVGFCTGKFPSVAKLANVVAEEPNRVSFLFREPPTVEWQFSLMFEIVPKHVYDRLLEADINSDRGDAVIGARPVGSGPFKFKHSADSEFVLERFEGYSPPCHIRTVRFLEKDDSDALDLVLDGQVDVAEIDFDQYTRSFEDETINQLQIACPSSGNTAAVLWNCSDQRFADPRIRSALAQAINTRNIRETVYHGRGSLSCGLWPKTSRFASTLTEPLPFSQESASRLLDACSWEIDKTGSRKDPDGKQMDFSLAFKANNESARLISQRIRDNLAALGIDVRPQILEEEEFTSRWKDGDFDAIIAAPIRATVQPSRIGDFIWTNGEMNFSSYTNARVDELFRVIGGTNDPSVYESSMREIDRIIFEDQPMTFLVHPPAPYAFSNRLRGVKFSARGPFMFYPGVEGWWVPRQ